MKFRPEYSDLRPEYLEVSLVSNVSRLASDI